MNAWCGCATVYLLVILLLRESAFWISMKFCIEFSFGFHRWNAAQNGRCCWPEGDQGSSLGYYTHRWSRKGRRSCRQLARPCSWTRCGNPMQRVRAGTTPRPCLCTQTLCSWTPATTSCTQIALQPSSRWDSLPRHCKMPSAPESSTASGPRYKNTNPAMHISLLQHICN